MTRVEHLRRHPFLAYEEEWIRVRAYFRHLNDPAASPDANWLAAEAELLEEIARGVFVWPTNDLMLDDFYDPPVGFRVRIGEAGAKRYVGSCAPRVCVWCTRRVPEATFRTDAHLISETFGNRSLFTLEECDECNYRHGTQLEDHLAKMLLDIRVFAQMRTKSGGVAKTKFGQGPAWVGGTPRPGPLRIEAFDTDPSIKLTSVGENRAELMMPPVRLRPLSALRAIGRMAYLAMPNHLRERHAALREWVNGDRAYAPMKLWQFFYPTAFKTVGVHVWSRCVGNDLPEAVAIFHCAHALLVIAPSASADTAVVLPPLLKPSPDADNLDGWVTTFESDDRVTEQWAYTIRGTDDVVLSDVGESLPVAVRIACGDTQLVFEADLRTATPANPDRLVTYEISGGGMPGTLTLTTTDGGRRWSCKVASAATPLALQLAHLLSQGAAFTVDDRKGRQIFPKATGWIAPPI